MCNSVVNSSFKNLPELSCVIFGIEWIELMIVNGSVVDGWMDGWMYLLCILRCVCTYKQSRVCRSIQIYIYHC